MAVIDNGVLEAWLTQAIEGFRGPLDCRRSSQGQNPTFVLTTPKRRYVMRKMPDGFQPPSVEAIEREYRVRRALEGAGVPVARTLAFCEDASVIGAPFLVVAHVEGRIFWRPTLPALSFDHRAALYDEMNRVIARLHDVDYVAAGLADFARPGHYLERQIGRWSQHYGQSQTRPIEAMDCLIDWLPKHLPPAGATAIIHGDLRIDNMIFHPNEPRVIALLDWELSTLGDPLADFGCHLLAWCLPEGEFRGMAGADLAALGIPCVESYFQRYAKRRGLGAVDPDLRDYHLVYNLFRLAAILQGVSKRAEDGRASLAQPGETGAQARPIAEAAWRMARERLGAA